MIFNVVLIQISEKHLQRVTAVVHFHLYEVQSG